MVCQIGFNTRLLIVSVLEANEQPTGITIENGFLSDFWRDLIALLGAGGVILTAFGVLLAIWQLYRTRKATEAAIESLNKSKEKYDSYVVSLANKLFSEARIFVDEAKWELARQRVYDVADQITQFSDQDADWEQLADTLRTFGDQFHRISKEEISFTGLKKKWRELQATVSKKISQHHGPFQPAQEKDND